MYVLTVTQFTDTNNNQKGSAIPRLMLFGGTGPSHQKQSGILDP